VYSLTVHHMRPPEILVDTASAVPAYRQIVDQLRTLIVEGALKPGDALPAVRQLAMNLGIHFNTVAEAYRKIAAEGLIEITRGHGARVVDCELPRRASAEAAPAFRRKLRELIAGVRADGLAPQKIVAELNTAAAALEDL
jgi:GntR family transcriptional regulator